MMKDITMHKVYEMAGKWPSGLQKASEIVDQVGVTAEQLLLWAEQGICPHFRINDGAPFFRLPDVRRWMLEAMVVAECAGVAKSEAFTLRVISDRPNIDELPIELRSVGKVFDVSRNLLPTGVYFLYLGKVLQYIGQSIEPATRLSQHRHAGKVFDKAFVLPTPSFMLDEVEGSLIRHFRPPLNANQAPVVSAKRAADTLLQLGLVEAELDGIEKADAVGEIEEKAA